LLVSCAVCCLAGQLLAIPGSPASHLYFLTRGYADVYMNDLLIDTLVPGESFSELVSRQPLSWPLWERGPVGLHAC